MNRILELLKNAIARHSYAIWQQEGEPEGRAEQHWLIAEQSFVFILRRLISERAHQIWEEEGKPEGRAEQHWIQAEEDFFIIIDEEINRIEFESEPSEPVKIPDSVIKRWFHSLIQYSIRLIEKMDKRYD